MHGPIDMLNAVGAGPVAVGWFAEPTPRGTVHSVFGRTLNIRTKNDRLVALCRSSVPLSPFSLILDSHRSLRSYAVEAGEPVRFRESTLHLGEEGPRIDCSDLRSFGSCVAWDRRPTPETLDQGRRHLIDGLGAHGVPGGFLPLLSRLGQTDAPSDSSLPVQKPFLDRAGTVLDESLRRCRQAATPAKGVWSEWAGLGPGSTPSGDDALVGLLAAGGLSTPVGEHAGTSAEWIERLRETALSRTSWFSGQWIDAASRCQFSRPLRNLVLCVIRGSGKEAVDSVTRSLCAMGETSGTDVAVGFLAGLTSVCTGSETVKQAGTM